MPQEIVVTSVPRGLDGGSGLQIVKRTRGMPLAVTERLHQKSGYTHHFPAGDKRNPVVVSCRIERLRNGVVHVLSLIKDAGADHTGRQNSLAHLIAFDEADIFEKQAGPAPVAKKLRDARLFLDSWNQQPHESEAPVVISPRSEPGICTAWRAAGFDPGIAGEIAASAIAGKRAVVIVPPEADVVSLFADAMLLMPPDARWMTTFTTSGIGNADYVWQAVRADLPQAETARKLPGVIDLTESPSAADGPYVDFARSGKGTLPWQQPAASDESGSVAPALPTVETDGSSQNLDVSEAVALVNVPPVGGFAPPGVSHPGTGATSQPQPGGLDERQFDGHDSKPPSGNGERQSNPILRNAGLCVVACIFLFAVGLAIRFHKEITMRLSTLAFSSHAGRVDQSNDGGRSPEQASIPDVAGDLEQQKQDKITAEAVLEAELAAERMVAKQKEKDDAEAHQKRRDAEQMAAAKKKKESQLRELLREQIRQRAFKEFNALPPFISLPAEAQLGVDEQKTKPVLIGTFSVDDLISFRPKIAVPSGTKMQIRKKQDGSNRWWVIESVAENVQGDTVSTELAFMWCPQGDNENESGKFFIEPCSPDVFRLAEYKLLLRSAILLSAILPGEGSSERVVKQLNLIKPMRGQEINLKAGNNYGERKQCSLGVSQTLWGSSSSTNPLKIDDLKIKLRVVSPCGLNGDLGKRVVEVDEEFRVQPEQPDYFTYEVPILKSLGKELLLKITVCPRQDQIRWQQLIRICNFQRVRTQCWKQLLKITLTNLKKMKKVSTRT